MNPCSVCTDPRRASIDAALGKGDPLRAVASSYGLSKSALDRHRNHPAGWPRPSRNPLATRGEANGHDGLTPRQMAVVDVLMAGVSITKAAELSGVTKTQLLKWLNRVQHAEFQNEIRRRLKTERMLFESRAGMLGQKAIGVIAKGMDGDASDTQLTAGRIAINSAVRLIARYQELHVEGILQRPVPLVIFQEHTRMPWTGASSAWFGRRSQQAGGRRRGGRPSQGGVRRG